MKKIFAIAGISALFAFSAAAETWEGTISDAHCGAKHVAGTAADAKCVETCVKGGADPVFISGDKVLKISEDSKDKVMSHLGHKVTLSGTLDGDTVHVDSVKM